MFLLLEDEFGTINLIVPPDVYERHRLLVRSEPLLLAAGRLEKLPDRGRGAERLRARPCGRCRTPGERVGRRRAAARPSGEAGPTWCRPGMPRGRAGARRAVAVGGAAAPPPDEIPADGGMADFRGVAPAVQSFAAGRRR